MGSEFRDNIRDLVVDREAHTTEQCRLLPGGQPFVAEYEELTPLDLITEIGNDQREAGNLYIRDAAIIAAIGNQSNTQVEITLYGQPHTFTLLAREHNPGSPQAKYPVKYNVPGIDS